MKTVPAKALALGFAVLVFMGALFLLEGHRNRAAAESLRVSTVTERSADGGIALHVMWKWDPPIGRRTWGAREELLAVSFDTRALVWMEEKAPAGTGARGEVLRKLEEAAGPDGARRLFVMQEGVDGEVTLRFRPKYPGIEPVAQPFEIYVAFDRSKASVWMSEAAVPDGRQMTAGKQDF